VERTRWAHRLPDGHRLVIHNSADCVIGSPTPTPRRNVATAEMCFCVAGNYHVVGSDV